MISNPLPIVVLQYPREKKIAISSIPVLAESLENVQIRPGLSWKNFHQAVGDAQALPSEWAVLYLGSKKIPLPEAPLTVFDRRGEALSLEQLPSTIRGLLVLDGTWAQAKTLWWRNPWLLKLNRLVLNPRRRSLYGQLRREPRRECLSTLESIALTLPVLGAPQKVQTDLMRRFQSFLDDQKPTAYH